MRSNRALHRCFLNRLAAGIAEAEEDILGTAGLVLSEEGERLLQGLHTEVSILPGALGAVEEGGEVDELGTRVHEAQVDQIDIGWGCPIRHGASLDAPPTTATAG